MMGYYLSDHPNPNAGQYVTQRRGIYGQLSGTVIMHTAEGYGAANVAGFIARREDYGSYHRLVDPNTIIEMAHWEWETWQDSETNNWAVGISAACNARDWLGIEIQTRLKYYRNLAICAADFVRYMRENYDIEVPRVRISGEQARARVPGFCAHGDSGLSRFDPGPDFDWETFFAMTNEELGEEDEDMAITDNDLERIAHHFLNKQAFSPTKEFPKPPTVSEALKAQHYAMFNNSKTNESIIGKESLPGLVNQTGLNIRADIAEVLKEVKK
ncbi:endolysin [Arthrobacter phage Jasmine]|uniref:Lysin A, N-acetylmuramoyl-L-alanine amidase domain n=1 Tax=Arthrobacter phage Jasmine TaxID=1772302 RepID=A0A0U4B3G8_9CAUD|nr:endolysin [Arthrobacter phage Jasmine]ALY09293.1 lysin A, N-acetylmuramoyl-L-alanine amidase domain [Arthrobacter phage Jasmine]